MCSENLGTRGCGSGPQQTSPKLAGCLEVVAGRIADLYRTDMYESGLYVFELK